MCVCVSAAKRSWSTDWGDHVPGAKTRHQCQKRPCATYFCLNCVAVDQSSWMFCWICERAILHKLTFSSIVRRTRTFEQMPRMHAGSWSSKYATDLRTQRSCGSCGNLPCRIVSLVSVGVIKLDESTSILFWLSRGPVFHSTQLLAAREMHDEDSIGVNPHPTRCPSRLCEHDFRMKPTRQWNSSTSSRFCFLVHIARTNTLRRISEDQKAIIVAKVRVTAVSIRTLSYFPADRSQVDSFSGLCSAWQFSEGIIEDNY